MTRFAALILLILASMPGREGADVWPTADVDARSATFSTHAGAPFSSHEENTTLPSRSRSGRSPSSASSAELSIGARPQAEGPAEWSRFRGPNGSGVADATGLPTELGPDRNVIWKTAIPPGYSSPILSERRIFLTALEDERLFTIAVDRDSGEILWKREAPRPRVETLDPRNNPAAPSPAVDGERVYVFFPEFGLLVYDLDGTELWRMPLGPFDNLYGRGASPVVHDGVVLLVCDQRTGSFLLAVDGARGDVVWRVERPEAASSHATPIVWQPEDGEPQLIVVGSFLLSGYSIATGERLWWVRGMIHEMKSVPVIGDGIVYVNGYGSPLNDPGNTMEVGTFDAALAAHDADGDGLLVREELPEDSRARRRIGMSDLDRDGRLDRRDWEYFRNSMAMTNGMFAIRLGGSGDMTAESFLWIYSRAVPQLPSPLLYGGVLYMVNDGGIVTILDPQTGERLDQDRLEGAVDHYYASPVAADGKIYMVSELGKVAVLTPGPELDLIAVNDLDDTVYGTPALAGDRIYLRTGTTLYCFGLTNGG
jgi:outer membrane protein assembly factor BamB